VLLASTPLHTSEDDLVGSTSALEKVAKLIPEQCLNLVCVLTLFPPKPTQEMAFSLSSQVIKIVLNVLFYLTVLLCVCTFARTQWLQLQNEPTQDW
jgi:hypothetical protein